MFFLVDHRSKKFIIPASYAWSTADSRTFSPSGRFIADRKHSVLQKQARQFSGVFLNPFSPIGNTTSSFPKHGRCFPFLKALEWGLGIWFSWLLFLRLWFDPLLVCPVHFGNIPLICKTEIFIIADDNMFVNRYTHQPACKNKLLCDGNIFCGWSRIS